MGVSPRCLRVRADVLGISKQNLQRDAKKVYEFIILLFFNLVRCEKYILWMSGSC